MRRARLALSLALAIAAAGLFLGATDGHAADGNAAAPNARAADVGAAADTRGVGAAPANDQLAALRREGAAVYARYCVGCHGVNGDGKGAAAPMLITKPRDFTAGVFKFRSTPSGTLPTDEDLYKIVTRGVYRTSMPDWALLTERERVGVVQYIKGFYPQWDERGAGAPIALPKPPPTLGTPDAVARGRELYTMLECTTCHGDSGRGDGPSASQLPPDVWGNRQRPFDFTLGRLKSGPTVQDVYRTFMTGVGGTAMPSYADIFGEPDGENIREGDAWNLVSYILSLRTPAPGGAAAEAQSPASGTAVAAVDAPKEPAR